MATHDRELNLWNEFWGDRSKVNQNALMLFYQPAVRVLAKYLFKLYGTPADDYGDFVQNGQLGLCDAIERYDVSFNAEFRTYANYRIRGFIINGMKKLSERNSFYDFQKNQRKARVDSIVPEKSNNIGLAELIGEAVIQIAYSELLDTIYVNDIGVGLEGESLRFDAPLVTEAPKSWNDPYQAYSLDNLLLLVKEKILLLTETEQQVIKMHYFGGIGFLEIGQTLNVTKGRVSQIHKQAISKLQRICQTQKII